jgi:hypothetical protein
MSRAALALALSALLAAAALPAAAAAAAPADCASKVANAVSLCKGELQSILWRAQSGLKADITALSPTPQCCGAASAAFDPAFVSACGCDAGVIKQTVAVDAALLETLRGAVAAKCGAASLAPFPVCGPAAILAALPSAEAYAAAASAAAAVTPQAKAPVTRRPTAARIVNGVVIKAGPGAYCTYTAKCKTFRFKPTTKNATLEKTLTAWRAKAAAGFCTKTASPIGTDDSELGIVVCGNNGVDNFFVEKQTVVVSRRNNVTREDLLYKLCQPKGRCVCACVCVFVCVCVCVCVCAAIPSNLQSSKPSIAHFRAFLNSTFLPAQRVQRRARQVV